MTWTHLCRESLRLRDYGNVRCVLRQGHDGDHRAVSPYDSRDIRWKQRGSYPKDPSSSRAVRATS